MSAQDQAQREDAGRPVSQTRPPPWRDERVLRVVAQVVFLALVLGLLWSLGQNLVTNMSRQGLRTDFGFLDQAAGFPIGGTDFDPRNSVSRALLVGLYNTVIVAVWGIVLASLLGVLVGVARLSSNWLVRKSAAGFVEALRNIPLIVLLFFLYLAVLQRLPIISEALEPAGVIVLSNRGLFVPWAQLQEGAGDYLWVLAVAVVAALVVAWWRTRRFDETGAPHHRVLWALGAFLVIAVVGWLGMDRPLLPSLPVRDGRVIEGGKELTVEHGALLFGLVIYMAAFIAEIVRGSILAVPRGQSEAASALGLSGLQRLRHVILPQALRIAIPPTGNEYINLAKNSALGIAVAFPELLRVTRISISQGNPAPQLIGVMMLFYLALSIILSLVMNGLNRRLGMRGT